jgi:hypothetical protein
MFFTQFVYASFEVILKTSFSFVLQVPFKL